MTEPSLSLVAYDEGILPPEDTATQPDRRMGDRPDSIPSFEGETVVSTGAKITSVGKLEIADRVFRIDESVKLIVEATVVGVHHAPNAKGELERIHTLKAMETVIIDWAIDMDALTSALGND